MQAAVSMGSKDAGLGAGGKGEEATTNQVEGISSAEKAGVSSCA